MTAVAALEPLAAAPATECATCPPDQPPNIECTPCMATYRTQAQAFYSSVEPDTRMDSPPVVRWIRHLVQAGGLTYGRITMATGSYVSTKLISQIMGNRGKHSVRSQVALAILAVDPQPDAGPAYVVPRRVDEYVPATGSQRRLQGMLAQGFTRTFLANALGRVRGDSVTLWLTRAQLPRETADAIAKLAFEMEGKDGDNWVMVATCERKGWLPLSAWGPDIDNPDAKPMDLRPWSETHPQQRTLADVGRHAEPQLPVEEDLCLVDPVVIYRTLRGETPRSMTMMEEIQTVRMGQLPWPEGPEINNIVLGRLIGRSDQQVIRIKGQLGTVDMVRGGEIGADALDETTRLLLVAMACLPAPYGWAMTTDELQDLLNMDAESTAQLCRQAAIYYRRTRQTRPDSRATREVVPAEQFAVSAGVPEEPDVWPLPRVPEPGERFYARVRAVADALNGRHAFKRHYAAPHRALVKAAQAGSCAA